MTRLLEFMGAPTPETLLAAMDELCAGDAYSPYAFEVVQLTEHLENGDFRVVLDKVRGQAKTLMLSPAAHQMASMAASELGDEDAFMFEQGLAGVLLKCTLATGDGSRERPYQLSIPWDAYSLLAVLQIEPDTQSLEKDGDRWLDVYRDRTGREVAFDITRPYNRMAGGIPGAEG